MNYLKNFFELILQNAIFIYLFIYFRLVPSPVSNGGSTILSRLQSVSKPVVEASKLLPLLKKKNTDYILRKLEVFYVIYIKMYCFFDGFQLQFITKIIYNFSKKTI